MAIKANIVIDQGTDFSAIVDVEDDVGGAWDLTGWNAFAQMRKNYSSTTSHDFLCSDNNGGGQITLAMTSNTTKDLEPGRYLYDIEIQSSGGTVIRVVEGVATVTPGITRSV